MAYARKSTQHELITLRDEITQEINVDAEHLSKSIFGDLGKHPDVERMSDEEIDALYRGAYQRDDRKFLQAEARRDPEQFIKVASRLGVTIPPPPLPPSTIVPLATPQAAPMPVATPAPMAPPVAGPPSPLPAAFPAPVAFPPPIPTVPAPVIYGPDGQPLT